MKIKRRPITLLEIMIVIFLIGIIGSVVSYTMKGSLDEGRSFKSEKGSRQVHDLLTLKLAEGTPMDEVLRHPIDFLEESGLVENGEKALKDGWNRPFEIVKIDEDTFIVYSSNWEKFLTQKKKQTKVHLQEEYPWAFHFDETEL